MNYQLKPEIRVGRLSDIIPQIEAIGNVLVLTSKSINKIHQIQEVFNYQNCQVISSVEPELPFSNIEKIYEELKVFPELIIAIGGGSVMDLGKALSVSNDFLTLKGFFSRHLTNYEKCARLFSVPTTFGTGAETSFGSILYDDINGIKDGLRSKFIQSDLVIIDSKLYKSAPLKLMAESGFDCLTHAIETYLSLATNDIIKYQSIAAINIIFDELENAVNTKDDKSIVKMGIASMMMGLNLAYSSTCLPHRIQYVIGPITQTSHAQGLLMLYKGWFKLINTKLDHQSEIQNLLNDLKMSFVELEEKIFLLRRRLNIDYGLSDFGIHEKDIDHIAKLVRGNLANDPFYTDLDSVKFLLKESL
jgi:alcohol dehydrogenase class IV